MAYKGYCKSVGSSYGFVCCEETFAQYGRDVFLNQGLIGEQYLSLKRGEEILFDLQLDAKGQPQAFNITQTGQMTTLMSQGTPAPGTGLRPPMGLARTFTAPAQPSYSLPPTAQPVTLHGIAGYFIPATDVASPAAAAQKRPMPGAMPPAKRFAGGQLFPGGPMLPPVHSCMDPNAPPVPNPGLDDTQPAFAGVMKREVNIRTGYGFISCEDVQSMYPGKDVFLHAKLAPWIAAMQLMPGESVLFNMVENEKGDPQASRIVRA